MYDAKGMMSSYDTPAPAMREPPRPPRVSDTSQLWVWGLHPIGITWIHVTSGV